MNLSHPLPLRAAFAGLLLTFASACATVSPRVDGPDGPEDVGASCGSCMTRFTGGFCVGCVTGDADVSTAVTAASDVRADIGVAVVQGSAQAW